VYANGRERTASTTLNTAVFAPIPNARVMMTMALKPGFLAHIRRA